MKKKKYRYIYGPVPSWRLGRSLGIDPVSGEVKICSFDCVYCQLGGTRILTNRRKEFVPVREIVKEIKMLPPIKIDYITFSGAGEPTLAKNLGRMIKAVKKIRKEPVAVITNSSLMRAEDVKKDLLEADLVVAKLDAHSERIFRKINRPGEGLSLSEAIKAIKHFKARYKGKLALQIMFIKENEKFAEKIARIARDIAPDEVQINTPLRPCAVKPLSKERMEKIREHFRGLNVVSVYRTKKIKVKPVSRRDTLRRRGKV